LALNLDEFMPESDLTRDETLDAIEVAVARTLTHAFQTSVTVRVEDQLQILVYPYGGGAPTTITLGDIERKLRRHVQHQVDLELQLRKTLHEAKH